MQPEDLEQSPLAPPADLSLPPEREPFWGYFDLLLFLGIFAAPLLILVLLGRLASSGGHPQPGEISINPIAAFAVQFAVYGWIYFAFFIVFKFNYGRPVFRSLGWRKANINLFLVAVAGVALAIAIDVLATLIHTPQVKMPFDQLGDTPLDMFLLALTAVVVGPIFEELTFRGFLQPLLSRTLGVGPGILLTALLFGGLHAAEYEYAWQYVAAISLVGVALGILRERTNSIIPTTVLHAGFNSVSLFGLFASKFSHLPHK